MVKETAYAKINLALAVEDVENGYHRVKNLMIPISLNDQLFFEKSIDTKVISEIEIHDNICLKAALLFKQHFNIKEGVTITLKKQIPIMAGLAGGSSDACATLRGLNRLFHVNASIKELDSLAGMLGSDVPFFLYDGLALCTGRGEKVTPIKNSLPSKSVLIIKPTFGLSTKEIYQNYHYDGIPKDKPLNQLLDAISNQKKFESYIFNDLEPVALSIHSELNSLFSKIETLGYHPHISGSGPSIFILDADITDLNRIKEIDHSLNLFLCKTL